MASAAPTGENSAIGPAVVATATRSADVAIAVTLPFSVARTGSGSHHATTPSAVPVTTVPAASASAVTRPSWWPTRVRWPSAIDHSQMSPASSIAARRSPSCVINTTPVPA